MWLWGFQFMSALAKTELANGWRSGKNRCNTLSFRPCAKSDWTSVLGLVRSRGFNRLDRDLDIYAVGASSGRDTTYRRYVAVVPAPSQGHVAI
jgi:hypothetical protein